MTSILTARQAKFSQVSGNKAAMVERDRTSQQSSTPKSSPLSDPRPFAAPAQPQREPDAAAPGFDFSSVNILRQPTALAPALPPEVGPIQPKLSIGHPNDHFEQEADQVARQVVQRIHSPHMIQQQPHQIDPVQQLPVQRRSTAPSGAASSEFESSLNQARSGGSVMGEKVKGQMESAMGADFSNVKIHTDNRADQLSRSIQAKAFTTGSDVFFKRGEYKPNSRTGQELLAHELTHVVQQSGGIQRAPLPDVQRQELTFTKAPRQMIQCFKNPAHLHNVSLAVSETDNAMIKGHKMQLLVDIKTGHAPRGGEDYTHWDEFNKRPHSIYGVNLEYWENISVEYKFKADADTAAQDIQNNKDQGAGAAGKPWNDVYAYNPAALTFDHGDAQNTSWQQGVKQAKNNDFTKGTMTFEVLDKPGLHPRANEYQRRVLKFRIVLTDTYGERQEIFATQIIETANGNLVYSSYDDSAGNRMSTGGNVTDHGITEEDIFAGFSSVSNAEIVNLVQAIEEGNAQDFDYSEFKQVARAMETDEDMDLSKVILDDLGQRLISMRRGDANLEGSFGVPLHRAGQSYKQMAAGNGLLVALTKDTSVIKMYYTDGSTSTTTIGGKNGPADITSRQFSEIPIELVTSMTPKKK